MYSNHRPLYGTIAYFGRSWSVTFNTRETYGRNGCNISASSLSGYGEFPFDEFPNIPVIDFRTCEDWTIIGRVSVVEAFGRQSDWRKDVPLVEALELYKKAGCIVIEPRA